MLQATLNLIDHGMTIQEAINAPRISVTSAGGTVSCERGPFFPLMQPAQVFVATADLRNAVFDAVYQVDVTQVSST